MKRLLLCLAFWALGIAAGMADAPAPLVVGSVRDQTGEPVAGASITLLGATGPIASGFSAADGTFAIAGEDVRTVRIACDFCRGFDVSAGNGPVVAIVQRYRALLQRGPGGGDLDVLPYAHIESSVSLRPFVVLADSRGIFPGPLLSDRGLSRAGGLIIDNGVANYDLTANASPFLTMPAHSLDIASWSDARSAFRYGDRADAGTFLLAAPGGTASWAGGGSDGFVNTHASNVFTAYNAAAAGNRLESRSRIDLGATQVLPQGSVRETLSFGHGQIGPYPNNYLAQSFSSARISAQVVREQRRYADMSFDHGTYDLQLPATAIGSQWSDAGFRAGVESLGSARGFFEVAVRRSNGYYDAPGRLPLIEAGVDQFSVATGIRSDTQRTSVHASVAAFAVDFSGGPVEDEYASLQNSSGASLVTSSVDAQFRPDDRWDFDVLGTSTFRLPTLLERYALPPAAGTLAIDRNGLIQLTANYSDRSRLVAAATAYRQTTNGFDRGSVAGTGLWVAWQFAPRFALRSWALREFDTTAPVTHVVRFTPTGISATVGSAWLTYDGPKLRADVIFRRDLLDTATQSHVDFSVSETQSAALRWLLTSEVRHGVRYNGFAIRFGTGN